VNELRILFLELTKRCNLECVYCRAGKVPEEELSKDEVLGLVDEVASFARPLLIVTGGEPLMREDALEVASHASRKGLPVALATNGTLIDRNLAEDIRRAGIRRVSVSLDGAKPQVHDRMRGVKGAFDAALSGIGHLREAGVEVQVNTTVTRQNVSEVPEVLELCLKLGLRALHLFMFVPVGCGMEVGESVQLPPEDCDDVLRWLQGKSSDVPIELRATCAPQYFRIAGANSRRRLGCLAGVSACFISSAGDVQPCGYLPLSAGNIKERSIKEIWEGAEMFRSLRDPARLKGRCGACEYRYVCGGCRARAFAKGGDPLGEDPCCAYVPGTNMGAR